MHAARAETCTALDDVVRSFSCPHAKSASGSAPTAIAKGVAYGHVASSNVALNKPTEQSSTLAGASSSRAVDGNIATGWGGSSVAHTRTEDNPWWRVDLQAQRTIAAVRVVNRGDCCGTRLDLFTVKVGDQVCGSNLVVPEGETGDFICEGGPLVASSVTIELPGNGRVLAVRPLCSCSCYVRALALTTVSCLQLAEVEVYEAGPIVVSTENAAAGKPTSQSSTGYGGASSRAVDGNADTSWGSGSCTHTSTETDPWWRTDLEQELAIANVKITNRGCVAVAVRVLCRLPENVAGTVVATGCRTSKSKWATPTVGMPTPSVEASTVSLRGRHWM